VTKKTKRLYLAVVSGIIALQRLQRGSTSQEQLIDSSIHASMEEPFSNVGGARPGLRSVCQHMHVANFTVPEPVTSCVNSTPTSNKRVTDEKEHDGNGMECYFDL